MSDYKLLYTLDEDTTNGTSDVHYMSPEDIEGKNEIPTEIPQSDGREVFHDTEEEKNSQVTPPSGSEKYYKPEEMDNNDIEMSAPGAEAKYSPIDAINQVKADPANVNIVRYNDNNYVAHDDIKRYMDASDTRDYDIAVKNIINSNDDESLHNNGLKIVMSKSEFDKCTEEEKANLESATVELEIYK